ncbi:MAG: peptide chain release factor 1 [Victivallales bacterium]|nr:peptide chain release factor 1 [Victivallales bacterium]
MNLDSYISNSIQRRDELERQIAVFDFAKNGQSQFRQLNAEYQKLKKLTETWDLIQKTQKDLRDNEEMLAAETDPEFRETIQADIETCKERLPQLDRELKTLILPAHPNEGKDVIMEIRPAAGGDEAALFAADLCRMYQHYFEIKGWSYEVLDSADTPLGGLKNISMTVKGEGAWSLLRFESGVHRVQRVPITEAQGRIQTSTATVACMAEAEEVDFELKPEDLRIDVFRSSGAGGQGVNRTDSAVRVTHIPTGMFVACQQERSQHKNKAIAMTLLRSRLLAIKQAEEDNKNQSERRSQVGTGDRSERIRTYNFPQSRVTDHRYNLTFYDLDKIMQGNLDPLLGEIRAIDAERKFDELLNIQN